MVASKATTAEDYLAELPDDRREALEEVRATILENLPQGMVETMNWGMIAYEVPVEALPDSDVLPGSNDKKPLMYAALASQKRHMAVYLTSVFADQDIESWFRERYLASGKKLDMGKSCVRFTKLENLPVDLIGEVISRESLDDVIRRHEEGQS